MQKKKKGFTLVELLVVIAILAILAAVSVVGYLSFTEKAKQSNDETLLVQLNTILQADEVESKPETYGDVIKLIKDNGLLIENLTPSSSKNNFIYDLSSNRYNLYNDEQLTNLNDAKYWAIAKTEDEYNTYSNLCSVYSLAPLNQNLNLKYGFEDGLQNNYDNVKLENTTYDSKIILDVNANNLEVNAPLATVNHYGTCKNVNIIKVANKSYHEYGIVDELKVTSGHIEFMNNSKVLTIFIEGSEVSLKINDNVQNLEDIMIITNNGVVLPDSSLDIPNSVTPSMSVIEVRTAADIDKAMLNTFEDTSHKMYFKLQDNIILKNVLYLQAYMGKLTCTIDLNGFSISNLNTNGNILLIESQNNAPTLTIKNGELNCPNGKLFNFNGNNVKLINVTSNCRSFYEGKVSLNLYLENCNMTSNDKLFIINKNENVTINGGKYVCESDPVVTNNNGNITILDGYFENKCLKDIESVIHNGTNNENVDTTFGPKLNIYNGTFINKEGAPNISNKSILTISGGKYTSKQDLEKFLAPGHSFSPNKVDNYWVVD